MRIFVTIICRADGCHELYTPLIHTFSPSIEHTLPGATLSTSKLVMSELYLAINTAQSYWRGAGNRLHTLPTAACISTCNQSS